MKKRRFWIIVFLFTLFNGGGVMAQSREILLSQPRIKGVVSLEEAIAKRRSVRNFKVNNLSLSEISQLLWAAQGITDPQSGLRASPSAGALYPMEIYIINADGYFQYIPQKHILKVLSLDDLKDQLSAASLGQASVKNAPMSIIICGVPERITKKYKERGIRYMYIEAGHIAQNIHLEAVALGLGSVPIGAFDDNKVRSILTLPEDQMPLYIIPVGYIE
ncbi:MAG: SagB/ThcOx family dehydrogenase [Candidatus Omnitrophica bacterium]|nr:SagB/ThcOx family dehydrogenase [Candidatus Omnitrophota bacterium]